MTATEVVVDVTAEDIAAGKREDCESCPIALALRRACNASRAYVDMEDVFIEPSGPVGLNTGWQQTGGTPWKASDFMEAFDRGDHVEPFSFTLALKP